MIVERIIKHLEQSSKRSPCHTNRASSIGDPCVRRLVYDRVAWDCASPPDARLLMIFEEGNIHEVAVLNLLRRVGFEVFEQQVAFFDRQANLSGHIDATIQNPENQDEVFPVEIKSMAPHIWEQVRTQEDFRDPRRPWLQKYPAQMLCYLFFKAAPRGAMLLKNKSTGEIKEIWFELDLEEMDSILNKCKTINAAIERWAEAATEQARENTLPARIDNLDECKICGYGHLCRPDINFGAPIRFIDDPLFEKKLDRRAEVLEAGEEFSRLDREIKDELKAGCEGVDSLSQITGNWHIMGTKDRRGAWRFEFVSLLTQEESRK